MTVIVNTFWGGRVGQIVDRQISRSAPGGSVEVVDALSTKACVVLCSNALVSIAYTGVAVAHERWIDTVVASCLAHRDLGQAMIQPGSPYLARPIHMIIHELSLNLNGVLNSDRRSREVDLRLSVVGWHLGERIRPLHWELVRGQKEGGRRYFETTHHHVGKFLRRCPRGMWVETLGDPGSVVDSSVRDLETTAGFTHDDVERHVKNAIVARSHETDAVGAECLAVCLDPLDSTGPVQFTRYPVEGAQERPAFISGWVLTSGLISSPSMQSTTGSTYSACARYLEGGFSDGQTNLHIRTRLPLVAAHFGGPTVFAYETQPRATPPC